MLYFDVSQALPALACFEALGQWLAQLFLNIRYFQGRPLPVGARNLSLPSAGVFTWGPKRRSRAGGKASDAIIPFS